MPCPPYLAVKQHITDATTPSYNQPQPLTVAPSQISLHIGVEEQNESVPYAMNVPQHPEGPFGTPSIGRRPTPTMVDFMITDSASSMSSSCSFDSNGSITPSSATSFSVSECSSRRPSTRFDNQRVYALPSGSPTPKGAFTDTTNIPQPSYQSGLSTLQEPVQAPMIWTPNSNDIYGFSEGALSASHSHMLLASSYTPAQASYHEPMHGSANAESHAPSESHESQYKQYELCERLLELDPYPTSWQGNRRTRVRIANSPSNQSLHHLKPQSKGIRKRKQSGNGAARARSSKTYEQREFNGETIDVPIYKSKKTHVCELEFCHQGFERSEHLSRHRKVHSEITGEPVDLFMCPYLCYKIDKNGNKTHVFKDRPDNLFMHINNVHNTPLQRPDKSEGNKGPKRVTMLQAEELLANPEQGPESRRRWIKLFKRKEEENITHKKLLELIRSRDRRWDLFLKNELTRNHEKSQDNKTSRVRLLSNFWWLLGWDLVYASSTKIVDVANEFRGCSEVDHPDCTCHRKGYQETTFLDHDPRWIAFKNGQYTEEEANRPMKEGGWGIDMKTSQEWDLVRWDPRWWHYESEPTSEKRSQYLKDKVQSWRR